MSQSISGYRQDAYRSTTTDEPEANAGLEFRRKASSVAEGFPCDEPTVVSNACRSPRNEADAVLCDDKKLAAVQSDLWDTTKNVVKMIFSVLVGRMR